MIRKIINKIFHKHDFEQIGFVQREDSNMRYSVREYQCQDQTCNKIKWVDGREDPYEK